MGYRFGIFNFATLALGGYRSHLLYQSRQQHGHRRYHLVEITRWDLGYDDSFALTVSSYRLAFLQPFVESNVNV
jgi:hypothetical protein